MTPSLGLDTGLVAGLSEAITLLRSGGRVVLVGRLEGGSGADGREGRGRLGLIINFCGDPGGSILASTSVIILQC